MRQKTSIQGGASILIIMLMIALSAFGLLALYAARSDYRLAEKNAEWTQKYYELDADAWEETERLNGLLRGFVSPDGALTEAQRDIVAAQGWDIIGDDPLTVAKTVSRDAMHIEVTLALRPPGAGDPAYDVLGWREIQDEFDYNEGQNIWTGED